MMILDLHRQGLSVTAIARRTGRDPKTIRKYIERGLELPAYGPRQVGRPNKITPYLDYVRERIAAFPELTATRLTRELRERGYTGAYTAVKRFVAAIRPSDGPKPFEVRFETPPGHQAQVDFARFVTVFDDEPGITRIIWLFSMVLGHSRHIVARFGLHQDLQTLPRCHMAAFAAMGGVPIEILYDRMKTAVTGEDEQGHIIYNRSLLALAKHYGFHPRACRPYRTKTTDEIEQLLFGLSCYFPRTHGRAGAQAFALQIYRKAASRPLLVASSVSAAPGHGGLMFNPPPVHVNPSPPVPRKVSKNLVSVPR